MRTTGGLPPALHRGVSRVGAARGASLSSNSSELTAVGLGRGEGPGIPEIPTGPVTGLPQLRVGRPVTAREIDDFLAEEE